MARSDSSSFVPRHFVSFVLRYRTSAQTTRPPRFLGNPPVRALLFDPGRINVPVHRASALLLLTSVLPSALTKASAPALDYFGAPSHSPHARCLRFVVTVARGVARLRKTRFRLVDLLGRTRFEPAGFQREVSALTYVITCSSPKLGLAHRKRNKARWDVSRDRTGAEGGGRAWLRSRESREVERLQGANRAGLVRRESRVGFTGGTLQIRFEAIAQTSRLPPPPRVASSRRRAVRD